MSTIQKKTEQEKILELEERIKKLEQQQAKKPTYSKPWHEVYPDGNYPE
jgi:hypothetical protein